MKSALASLLVLSAILAGCGTDRRGSGQIVPVDGGTDSANASDFGHSEDSGRRDFGFEEDFGVELDAGSDAGRDGGSVGVESTLSTCSDTLDNDGDGYIDCNDFNCCAIVSCELGTSCNPRSDGGVIDMSFDAGPTPENTVSACSDGVDNDRDTYVDCNDFNCCSLVACGPTTACGRDGGVRDGSVSDAASDASTGVENNALYCSDTIDNDGDGYIDCEDFNCCDEVSCGPTTACGRIGDICGGPHAEITTLGDAVLTGAIETFTHSVRTGCDFNGSDLFFTFIAPSTGVYTIDTNNSTFDTGLGLYRGACSDYDYVDCDDDGGATSGASSITFTATAGELFAVFVDAYYAGEVGTFYVNIRAGE